MTKSSPGSKEGGGQGQRPLSCGFAEDRGELVVQGGQVAAETSRCQGMKGPINPFKEFRLLAQSNGKQNLF